MTVTDVFGFGRYKFVVFHCNITVRHLTHKSLYFALLVTNTVVTCQINAQVTCHINKHCCDLSNKCSSHMSHRSNTTNASYPSKPVDLPLLFLELFHLDPVKIFKVGEMQSFQRIRRNTVHSWEVYKKKPTQNIEKNFLNGLHRMH